MIETIRDLEKLSPRQGPCEDKARRYLEGRLTRMGIEFETDSFSNFLPKAISHSLKVDGVEVESMPTALRSGVIGGKALISSMHVSGRYYEQPNINFNPYSEVFSLATFYRAPSLTVRRKDLLKIIMAEEVEGKVRVTKQKHRCANIVVGKTSKPRSVLICHYDSVLGGALDNGSGTAALLELARRGYGKENMIVFSGCEELSFDEPIYWGRGYRELESSFGKALKSAKQIVVADMLGSSSPKYITDQKIRLAAFPIKDMGLFKRTKIVSVGGNEWLPIYHSAQDRIGLIKPHFLEEGLDLITSTVTK
jgi:hypothetical protein